MTRTEALALEYAGLRDRRLRTRIAASLASAGLAAVACRSFGAPPSVVLGAVLSFALAAGLLLDPCLKALSAEYGRNARRLAEVGGHLGEARERIGLIFSGYRERGRGEAFKSAYALAGRPLHSLEEALAVGMFRERREVFVTAFMRDGVAVRVTAAIGTPWRCAAADDPGRWRDHAARLCCDEIRQYHNHPDHGGHTAPSRTDCRSAARIATLLGPDGPRLRSLIICWNGFREWKVFGYAADGRSWLESEFDAVG